MKISHFIFLLLFSSTALAQQAPPSSVVVEEVRELEVGRPTVFNAFVRSRHDVLLPATVDGELVSVLSEGSKVIAGEVIAQVDDRNLRLRLQEQQLLADRAAINLAYLDGEVDRLSQLQQANLAAKTQLAELVSRRDLANNDLQVARSRIAQLEENLARTKVIAPTDAVIVERMIEPGEFARRGDSVVRIVNPKSLEVEILVPIAYLNRLDLNQPVVIKVAEVEFSAVVESLIQVSDRQSQTFGLLVSVPKETANRIAAGQFADATIAVSEQRRSLFVPRDAVVLRSEGNFVYKVNEENVAQRVAVQIGAGQGSLISIIGELEAGDRVAVRGVESLRDGQSVLPTS